VGEAALQKVRVDECILELRDAHTVLVEAAHVHGKPAARRKSDTRLHESLSVASRQVGTVTTRMPGSVAVPSDHAL
jgi:hypothetical protein